MFDSPREAQPFTRFGVCFASFLRAPRPRGGTSHAIGLGEGRCPVSSVWDPQPGPSFPLSIYSTASWRAFSSLERLLAKTFGVGQPARRLVRRSFSEGGSLGEAGLGCVKKQFSTQQAFTA